MGLILNNLLSGAVGGVIVFVLTTLTGVVVRTLQRGRELRGLSRVLWPEMKRNWKAIGVLRAAGFDSNTYRAEHPTRDAWGNTRIRLSQLMPEHDFAILANYYDDLEMLDAAVTHGDSLAQWHLDSAVEHQRPAMKVVEGYCNARWRPLKGHGPGPLRAGGWGESLLSPQSPEEEPSPTPTEPRPATEGAQEGTERSSWWSRLFGSSS
jgi:hypothetical protein